MPKKLKNLLLVLAVAWMAGSVSAAGVLIYPEDVSTESDTALVPVLVGGLPLGAAVVDGY